MTCLTQRNDTAVLKRGDEKVRITGVVSMLNKY